MTVVESRYDAAPLCVDHLGLGADQRLDGVIAADGDDAVPPHGQRLGLGLRLVQRPDFAVDQDEVGGHGRGRLGGAGGEGEQAGEQRRQQAAGHHAHSARGFGRATPHGTSTGSAGQGKGDETAAPLNGP